MSAPQATHAGCGLLWTMTRERSSRLSVVVAQMPSFSRSKRCGSPASARPPLPDHWGASTRHLDPEAHTASTHYIQTIERTPLTIRTRITRVVRQPICCTDTTPMHAMVLGVLVHRYACGRAVSMRLSPRWKPSPVVDASKGTLSPLRPGVMAALRGPHSLDHRKHEGCRQPE